MRIKKYLGKNQQDVVNKIKFDLGPDAVILNSRKVKKKGIFSLFSKPLIEITAAVQDKEEIETKSNKQNAQKQNTNINTKQKQSVQKEENNDMQKIQLKIDKLEGLLTNLANNIETNASEKEDKGEDKQEDKYEGMYKIFYDNLKNNNVEESIVEKIIEWAKEMVSNNPSQSIYNLLYNRLIFLLGKTKILEEGDTKKARVVLFVGSTGVGKTTTIAKLASNLILKKNKKIGFITADTYRIAAVEQLKIYSDILGVPLRVAYDEHDFGNAIEELKDNDYIFIDTAGRSHKNKEHMDELQRMVNLIKPDQTYLVMNVNTNVIDAKNIVDTYNFLEDYNFIFTKADETSIQGLILNMRYITKKPLSYITTGQNVPEDIQEVDVEEIAKKILGSIKAK